MQTDWTQRPPASRRAQGWRQEILVAPAMAPPQRVLELNASESVVLTLTPTPAVGAKGGVWSFRQLLDSGQRVRSFASCDQGVAMGFPAGRIIVDVSSSLVAFTMLATAGPGVTTTETQAINQILDAPPNPGASALMIPPPYARAVVLQALGLGAPGAGVQVSGSPIYELNGFATVRLGADSFSLKNLGAVPQTVAVLWEVTA